MGIGARAAGARASGGTAPGCYHLRPSRAPRLHMIELNPIRQRIADLRGRLDALRGYL